MNIDQPYLTGQERGEQIERGLRRLSTAQLCSRYRRLFGHAPRNRLGQRRNSLVLHLIYAMIEPGLRLKPPRWRGPVLKELMFHIFRVFPDISAEQILDWVKRDCPDSRMTAKEIPWYRHEFQKAPA